MSASAGRGGALRLGHAWLDGTYAVAHRELLSLFVTPLAYLVGTLFLLNQGWNFALLLNFLNDPLAAPGPVMQFYFGGSFFIFWLPVIFICSAMSMRLIAEERKQGTLEALLTAPLAPSQIVLGKFVGAYAFYLALWLPTGIFYVLLRGAAVSPEVGPILSGYLGVLLVGGTFIALGLLASSLVRSQLAAAVTTFVTCTILLLAGLLVDQVEAAWVADALQSTSLLAMMQELAQGIVDFRWIYVHVGAIVVLLAASVVVVDPRRRWENLLQLALLTVLVGHLGVFASRHSERDDWTAGHVYTLSERAREVLGGLEVTVDVTVVVPSTIGGGRPNPLAGELREVLRRMAAVSERLRVRFLDPDRDRQQAEATIADFGLGGRELADGVVLVRAGQGSKLRKSHLLPADLVTYATGPDVQVSGPRVKEFRGEEALLARFLAVADPQRTVVCYTQGHGEPAFDSLEPYRGYAHLRDLLSEANLEVRPAELDREEALGECNVLLIAGPEGPLPAEHVRQIERFAGEGGDLILLTGAVILRGQAELADNGLEALVASYGIHFGDRVVLDPHPVPGATPLLAFTLDDGWGDHPAVHSLIGQPVSLMTVRELSLDEGQATFLLQTSEQGWAEADIEGLQSGGVPRYDQSRDRLGPIPVAAAAERGGSRLVVIASQDFALNAVLRADVIYDHGRDLILNAIGWLAQRDALLGIRARQREHVKLILQPDQVERMSLVCLIGLPGFAIALGILVLWRRRR
ncbi:MAG: Gldg family protein [Myxococcales bacterium]|nr:Gldg family protein [Myxococcales bacterium]